MTLEPERRKNVSDLFEAAILFTDVVGSSRHLARDERGTLRRIRADFDTMRTSVRESGGEVIKEMGDGLLLLFPKPQQAYKWAVLTQSDFALRNLQERSESSLTHRIGLHFGPLRRVPGDIMGESVSITSRLEKKADPGGICLSQAVYETVARTALEDIESLGEQALHNIPKPLHLYRVRIPLSEKEARCRQTVNRILDGLERNLAANSNEVYRLYKELTAHAHKITVEELAHFILRDTTITAKILSVANTLAYNPTGQDVTTVTQAISVIGLNRVRDLTLNFLLAEGVEQADDKPEESAEGTRCLASGLLARHLAEQVGHPSPEEAFIAGSLRNYGHLLLSVFMPEYYPKARRLALEKGEETAYQEIFGISPDELTRLVLRRGKIARSILRSLDPVPSSRYGERWRVDEHATRKISEAASRVTRLVANKVAAQGADILQEAADILSFYGLPRVNQENLKIQLEGLVQSLRQFAPTSPNEGFAAVTGAIEEHSQASAAGPPSSDQEKASNLERRDRLTNAPFAPSRASPLTEEVRSLLELMGKKGVSAQEVYRQALRAIINATPFEACILCFSEDRPETFVPSVLEGPITILPGSSLSISHNPLFRLCMERNQEAFFNEPARESARRHLPSWLIDENTRALLILPLKDGLAPIGFVFARGPRRTLLAKTDTAQFRALRTILAVTRRLDLKRR